MKTEQQVQNHYKRNNHAAEAVALPLQACSQQTKSTETNRISSGHPVKVRTSHRPSSGASETQSPPFRTPSCHGSLKRGTTAGKHTGKHQHSQQQQVPALGFGGPRITPELYSYQVGRAGCLLRGRELFVQSMTFIVIIAHTYAVASRFLPLVPRRAPFRMPSILLVPGYPELALCHCGSRSA